MTENMPKSRIQRRVPDNPAMLLNEVSRLCMRVVNQNADNSQVRTQHSCRLILMYLAHHDGAMQCELVRITKMSAPSISAVLKSMESDGLVERRGDENDQRVTRVYITDDGRRADRENLKRIKEVDQLALSGLSDEEQKTLMTLLLRMRENLVKELNITDEAD